MPILRGLSLINPMISSEAKCCLCSDQSSEKQSERFDHTSCDSNQCVTNLPNQTRECLEGMDKDIIFSP